MEMGPEQLLNYLNDRTPICLNMGVVYLHYFLIYLRYF